MLLVFFIRTAVATQLHAVSQAGTLSVGGKTTLLGVLAALLAPRGLDAAAAPQRTLMAALADTWGSEGALVSLVLAAARQPFDDVSLAGLAAAEALSLSPWGRAALCAADARLVETVSDRRANASPAHLRWKVSMATVCWHTLFVWRY